MDSNIGKKLDGRYEITELIGVGGMADVYKAQDVMEDRPVAVKILKPEFSGDEGNGHWIAMMTYKTIYDDVYLGLGETALSKMFYDEYGITSREEFLDKVSCFEDEDNDPFIMRLIDFFFDASKLGDKKTLEIIESMAQRGADLITAHVKQLNFTDDVIEVVLSGSIHAKLPSEVYTDLLKEKCLAQSGRKMKFIVPDKPPVTGCINWILQQYA